MNDSTLLTYDAFADKSWKRFNNYSFASGEQIAEITLSEASACAIEYPILVSIRPNNDYKLHVLLGCSESRNAYISDHGHWIAMHIPAMLRIFPFEVLETAGEFPLSVINNSGYVLDNLSAEPFFEQGGALSKAVKEVNDFALEILRDTERTQVACSALFKHGLLQPWETENSYPGCDSIKNQHKLQALNVKAMSKLDAEALAELHRSGGNLLAHCLLISQQLLPLLKKREQQKAESMLSKKNSSSHEPDPISTLSDGESINFDNF